MNSHNPSHYLGTVGDFTNLYKPFDVEEGVAAAWSTRVFQMVL